MPADPPPSDPSAPPAAGAGRLQLLGLPRLLPAAGGALPLGPRDAALLALVVLRGPLTRATLAAWLWPDLAPGQGLNNLRQRLFQLRQQAGGALLHTAGNLSLAAGWQHDLAPQPAQWRPGDALPQLLGGADLRAWPALAERIAAERQHWRQAWRDAAVGQAEQCEAAGRLADAQVLAAAVLQVDPTSEHAHRRLMRLHYLRGDRSAALAAYGACRQVLAQQLGVAPGAETEALRALVAAGAVLPGPVAASVPASASAVPAPPGPVADHRPPPLAQPQQRAVLRRPPVLVGRETAWQAMASAWQGGQAIVLQGPPGVGKSRLADDFARAQGPVVVLHLQVADRRQPLSALVRWLAMLQPLLPSPPGWALPVLSHLLPVLGPPSGPPPSLPGLQQAVLAWLAPWAQAGLGALLIDDWTCMDSASLQVLAAWLHQDATLPAPLLLVQTSSQAEASTAAPGPPWWMQAGKADGPLVLALAPLPLPALAALLADLAAAQALPGIAHGRLPQLARRLHQASGGLPGAALALLRAVPAPAWCVATRPHPTPEQLPADGEQAAVRASALASVLGARMAALPAPALRLLRLAALAGAQFDVPLAAAVLGVHALDLADDWARLHDAHWLDSDGVLPEPLRDAVVAGVPPAVRRVLHAQLAQALADEGAAPEHRWHHWAAAGRWAEAAAAAADTARQAGAAHMPRAELAAWDAAAAACDAAGDADGAWHAGLAAVWPALSVAPVAQVLQRTAQLHDRATGVPQRIDALLARCRVALNASDSALALAPAAQAQRLAQDAGDAGRALHAGGWLWLARALAGEVQPALVQLQACAQAVAGQPDLRLRLDVLGAQGYVLHMAGHYHAAMDAIAQAAGCAEQLGALGDAVEQWLNLSLCATAVGDRPRALQAGDQALAAWRRQGEPAGGAVPSLHLQVGVLKLAQGQFSAGLPLLEQALAHFRSQGSTTWRVIAEHRLANAWLRLGQPARASQCLGPLPDDTSPGGRAARAMVLARLALWADQPAEPLLLAALQQHGERLEAMDSRALALQLAGTGPAGPALARCDALLQTVGGHPAATGAAAAGDAANQPTVVHALARRADALRRLGRHAEALADAHLAWQAGAHSPPLELGHPDFCLLVAQVAAAAGDAALQQQVLQSALAWMDGARPFLLPAWRHGFFHRHPANRALMAMAAAQGMVAPMPGAPLPAPA